ncbi:MAG: hypothetical protein U0326_28095 [Polyangiales bacterium]
MRPACFTARLRLFSVLLCAGIAACAPEGVRQAAAAMDGEGGPASPTRYLRQLSFDLRGAPPTVEEYRQVVDHGEVPASLVDGMLHDPRFIDRVKRWHADLLWPNMGGFELLPGGRLVVVPARGQGLGPDNINPEWLVQAMDRRTSEATCPPPGDPAHLTAASCCTAADPNHPSCCLVRNATYNPDDPACVAKSAALPAVFSYGVSVGDRALRGSNTYTGCDVDVPYPPPRVAATDRTWPHEASGRPYYVSPKNGQRRYYYDDRDVPLPYHSFRTCPNYCRAAAPTGPGGQWAREDFIAKSRTEGGVRVEGDGPGYACPAGYTEIENPCDNHDVDDRIQSRVELRREGWVLTRPYWAGGHWVKTCAYESQTRAVSLNRRIACKPGYFLDATCGCGPDGAWCSPFSSVVSRPSRTVSRLLSALNREPLELIASVVERNEDYATIFTTRRGLANGPLAFMNRYQTAQMGELEFSPSAPPEALPDIAVDDLTWREYQRGPEHNGILTTPVFLARFPTRRARINRFWTSFLCRPFGASSTPIPPPEDACHREPNLARRCGCSTCHSIIEPMGAAWGRWAERGTNYLDTANFPVFDPACSTCGGAWCPPRCKHYVTASRPGESVPSQGTLQSYLYRSSADLRRIDAGPCALIADALAVGEIQSCAASTAWQRLLNRPMSEREQADVLPALVHIFEAHGRNYRELVRAIVSSPAYRRID